MSISTEAVQRIDFDASRWTGRADFYAALLPRLGAPEWVGGNLDALFDSFAGNNTLAPPYDVVVHGLKAMPPAELAYIRRAEQVFADARAEFGHWVSLRFE
ncbi:barstar family protein [Sphingomonas aerophila]|uniref:RNAse (Barnase) inhibitor barstar n=1 Tax=Sphingomonas aerophila TaxID=1344948 RepID=A0A7W9EUR6_9SPHN|nr:barstar family protein [Sphingomonas aerophila]MBB5715476.1 RNAse (barnase) inhibitor barstar [Sphingomonas aerophila]